MLRARRCQVCAQVVTAGHGDGGLCPGCASALRLRQRGFCPRCGQIYAQDNAGPYLCAACRKSPPAWDGFGFLGPYTGVLRDLILEFKFKARFERRKLLGALLVQAYAFHLAGSAPQAVVPVALHTQRLRQRGFNQSLEIARSLHQTYRIPIVPTALERIRPTEAQSGLGRKERLSNVRGAFRARPDTVAGQEILLVDDVSTTGATLNACATALRLAGAVRVHAVVLAVAAP